MVSHIYILSRDLSVLGCSVSFGHFQSFVLSRYSIRLTVCDGPRPGRVHGFTVERVGADDF